MQGNEQARQGGMGFGQPGAVNTVTIVDEPEENTTIYSYRDGQLKKLPYEEHEAKTGQKIKMFMSFEKKEKVVVITVNKEEMCLLVNAGTIEDNALKKVDKPLRYYASETSAKDAPEYMHKMSPDKPVLMFSLDPSNFGEEIKGKNVRDVGYVTVGHDGQKCIGIAVI